MISLGVQKNPMFVRLLQLQWKSYRRSAAFTSGVITSVFYLFGMLYFIGMFMLLGYGSFYVLDEEMGVDPLRFINQYMIYGTSFWIVWRYFIQKMPVLNIQALLTLPIKVNTIVHYALGRTIFSFFMNDVNICPPKFLLFKNDIFEIKSGQGCLYINYELFRKISKF